MLLTDVALLPYRAGRLAVRSVRALDRFVDQAGSLTGAAVSLDDTGTRVVAGADGLDATDEVLEESLDSVADTLEPLQPAAEKVGRLTRRFSRD